MRNTADVSLSADLGLHSFAACVYLILAICAVVQFIRLRVHIANSGMRWNQLFHRQLLCILIGTGALGILLIFVTQGQLT